jgi:hypothetical protein
MMGAVDVPPVATTYGEPVWYAAYGSNLDPDRFACYLRGGCPPGATRTYPGTRDGGEALDARPLELSGRLCFAWESPTWGGGIAFYEAAGDTTVLARGYLLTPAQLSDVIEQEMRRVPGVDHDFAEVVGSGRQVLGPGRYETLHLAGEIDGRPVLTFGTEDVEVLGLRPPAPAYVATIARGLRRTHRLDDGAIVDYLLACPGTRPGWEPEQLAAVVSDFR